MKRYILTLVAFLALSFLFTACMPARTVAYKTLASVKYTVDAQMTAYGAACRQGLVTAEKQKEIDNLFDNKFQPAFHAAVLAAKMDYKAAAPEDIVKLATELIGAINAILPPKPQTKSNYESMGSPYRASWYSVSLQTVG